MDVAIGSRFTCEDLYWVVVEKISDGVFQLECETAGTIANNNTGSLIPVDYIQNLATATLTDLLIPGADEESDEELRIRYFSASNNNAFGGNIEDYKEKIGMLDGVGAVKVIPVWNGGGTVKIILLDSDFNKASNFLIETIQEAVCPDSTDQGTGIAPIGHKVTISTVEEKEINIATTVSISSGANVSTIKNSIEEVVEGYLLNLRKTWEDNTSIVIRISQIEALILNVEGIIDISGTTINEQTSNIEMNSTYIPVIGNIEVETLEVQSL